MVDIIRLINRGFEKVGGSGVSHNVESLDNLFDELLKILLSEMKDETGDLLSGANTLSILPLIANPQSLVPLTVQMENQNLNSKLNPNFVDNLSLSALDSLNSNKLAHSLIGVKDNGQSSDFENTEVLTSFDRVQSLGKVLDSGKEALSKTNLIHEFTENSTAPLELSQTEERTLIFDTNLKTQTVDRESSLLFIERNEENQAEKTLKDSVRVESHNILDRGIQRADSSSTQIKPLEKGLEIPTFRLSEIAEAITKTLSTQNRTLVVQLEPPELGKIMIKLTLDNNGLRADLRVDYLHVKEMITGLIPEIKSNLQSSGIRLSDFVLDLMRDHREYRDSSQGQKRNRGNHRFIEYFA